jgi:hypothetical protein
MTDPTETAAREAAGAAAHLPLLAIGAGAALLRLLTYAGPPRPWRVVMLDAVVMTCTGFAAAEAAIAAHWGLHGAIATGIAAGLIGWESVKRALANRLTKETK